MQDPSRQCSLGAVDRVQENGLSLRHINQGVLPKELALLPTATGGEHCSVTEAIKLGCENNSPDGRGNKVREQEAGGSLKTLLLGHDGPASGKRPPSLIAAEPEIRADQLPAPRSQERELETTHSLVAPSALGRHANEAAQRYLATIEGKVCENFVWNRQMRDFPDGSPHLPKLALPARPVELTHETLEVDQVLSRQYRLARVHHTQVLSNLMSSAHDILGSHPRTRNESTSLPVWL